MTWKTGKLMMQNREGQIARTEVLRYARRMDSCGGKDPTQKQSQFIHIKRYEEKEYAPRSTWMGRRGSGSIQKFSADCFYFLSHNWRMKIGYLVSDVYKARKMHA